MKAALVLFFLYLGSALCASYPSHNQTMTFTSQEENGFETAIVGDMSFITELNYQTFPSRWFPNQTIQTNMTFYIFGNTGAFGRARTVYPHAHGFNVAPAPSDTWFLPFIDTHSFQDAEQNTWFIGLTNPIRYFNISGYALELAIISTRMPFQNARFFNTPIGFHGTYYSLVVIPISETNIIAYFAGFFLIGPGNLAYGVSRAHFNIDNIRTANPVLTFDPAVDQVVINPNTQFVLYNQDFKPFIFHTFWDVPGMPNIPNATFTYVVDPYLGQINIIQGSIDPTVPLTLSSFSFQHTFPYTISSAVIYYPLGLLIIGLSAPGIETGSIAIHPLGSLVDVTYVQLPTNMSDPKALVIDWFDVNNQTGFGVLYVALNGGGAVLRYNITNATIPLTLTGQQNLPHHLHRAWTGLSTPEHLYFATNEQVSKVFRMSKRDFCPNQCMKYGYCHHGKCVCEEPLRQNGNQCDWQEIIRDRNTIKKDHDGEVALGILFMFSTIAAAAFGFLWYRGRRSSYQAV